MRPPVYKLILITIPIFAVTGVTALVLWPRETTETGSRLPAAVSELKFKDTDRNADPKAAAREAADQTGLSVQRARKVHFDSEPLRAALWPGDRTVTFELFKDTRFRVRFMEPSPQLNRRGEFIGQVDGDSESRVHIWSTDRRLTGEIVTNGKTFRIVPLHRDVHYVIEVKQSGEPGL